MTKTWILSADGESITCLRCNMTSYNVNDIMYRFCGHCHAFHEDARCDFCSSPDVPLVAEYKPKGVLMAEIIYPRAGTVLDESPWGACKECKDLIESRKWKELTDRSIAGARALEPRIEEDDATLRQRHRALLEIVFGKIE